MLDLPAITDSFLASHDAARTAPHADGLTTAALLKERGYPPHEPALAFEADYGGLQIFDSPDVPALLVGPYACLSSSQYRSHERGLVPVIFACDDVIYSIDYKGHGWACAAMVEGVSRRTARDGRQLLTQAILWRVLATSPRLEHVEGPRGASRAAELGLAPLADATSDDERWWGYGARFVVEIPHGNGYPGPMTYVACL